jgi:hypothetical protein
MLIACKHLHHTECLSDYLYKLLKDDKPIKCPHVGAKSGKACDKDIEYGCIKFFTTESEAHALTMKINRMGALKQEAIVKCPGMIEKKQGELE